ncbi:MAG: SDR family NAD(P)-dependent oxidoreductase [Steroidobacteraceae bacterium]
MLEFGGRVALVTGGGRGIGRSHSLFFAGRGAKVVVNDFGVGLRGGHGNNPGPAESVAAEIQAGGGEAWAACTDIGDPDAVRAMVDEAVSRYGRLDVLVHNASVYSPLSAFADARAEDLERILRVNVLGGWHVIQAAWRRMVTQGYGRIVITGSGAGFFGRRRDHAYNIAKSALMGFTKALATEGSKLGIKVNLVGPVAWTDASKHQGIPLIMEKFAPPSCVTDLVAVLAHEDCPVTGEMFHCGGGFVARVFVGETVGTAFALGTMTPEAVMKGMDQIMDATGYAIPANSDRSGAHLSASIAAANPQFAQALAEAKRSRSST